MRMALEARDYRSLSRYVESTERCRLGLEITLKPGTYNLEDIPTLLLIHIVDIEDTNRFRIIYC
jgi:hypothetical protein